MRICRENVVAGLLVTVCIACSSQPTVTAGRVAGTQPGASNASAQDTASANAAPGAAAPSGASAGNSLLVQPAKPTLGGAAGSGLKDGQCAQQNVVTMRVEPTVWLVIDGSGSMVDALGDRSRWTALREALMDPADGVVKTLEHEVAWGVVIYDGATPGDIRVGLPDGGVAMFSAEPATTCPRVVTVEPKLDNFADIDMAYASSPLGGSTPTDQALQAVVSHLPDLSGQVLDGRVNPTIVVLATDGAPNNLCTTDFTMLDVQPNVINVVSTLASMNVKTYVISLAGGDQMLTQHLEQVAAAGMTGTSPFLPMNKAELVQTFKDIIGASPACDVVLNGSVKPGIECMGTIKINGAVLPCNDPNGWVLKDPSTVSIQGSACEDYRNNRTAILEADFPCEIIDLN